MKQLGVRSVDVVFCGLCSRGLELLIRFQERLFTATTGLNRFERALAGIAWSDVLISGAAAATRVTTAIITNVDAAIRDETRQRKVDDADSANLTGIIEDPELPTEKAAEALCWRLDVRLKYLHPLQHVVKELRAAHAARLQMDDHRSTPFSQETPAHFEKLTEIWRNLLPHHAVPDTLEPARDWAEPQPSPYLPPGVDSPASRWSHIGFQSDPSRDFRGVGVLGLENLFYFTTHHTSRAREVLHQANTSGLWFPFAATGLNITSWLLDLLSDNRLNLFFYSNSLDALTTFGVLYSYFFLEFSRFWRLSRPKDIMQFGTVSAKFRQKMDKVIAEIGSSATPSHGNWSIQTGTGEEVIEELVSWIDGEVHPHHHLSQLHGGEVVGRFSSC
eukprot:Polyplicarium_translucidae@DN1679_c0_g1_i3.p1